MEKILSIIIPTYNMEDYLHNCIDSLVIRDKNTFEKLDVLIINDGSKDSSSSIAHEYENRFPGVIRVIDKENGNYGSCINVGLKESIGKYVKVLDADDRVDNSNFQSFVEMLMSSDADLIVSDYCQVDANGTITKYVRFPIEPNKVMALSCSILNKAFSSIDFQMHAVAYKKSIFEDLNYCQTEGISYTDQEWMFKPMCSVETIQYFNSPLYLYLLGREGQTMNPQLQIKRVKDVEIGLNQMLKDYVNNSKESIDSYLKLRIAQRLKGLYQIYMYIYNDECKEKIESLDNQLKELGSLYEYSEGLVLNSRLKFKFVSFYRKGWHRTTVMVVRIYQLISNFVKS